MVGNPSCWNTNTSWTIQLLVSLRLMMNEPTGETVLYVVCATGNHSNVGVSLLGRGNVCSSTVPTDVLTKGILVCGLEIVGVSGQTNPPVTANAAPSDRTL